MSGFRSAVLLFVFYLLPLGFVPIFYFVPHCGSLECFVIHFVLSIVFFIVSLCIVFVSGCSRDYNTHTYHSLQGSVFYHIERNIETLWPCKSLYPPPCNIVVVNIMSTYTRHTPGNVEFFFTFNCQTAFFFKGKRILYCGFPGVDFPIVLPSFLLFQVSVLLFSFCLQKFL